MKRLLPLLLALLLIVGLAACGGGDDPPTTEETPAPQTPELPPEEVEDLSPVLRIGALFTLIGAGAEHGTDQREAMLLWLDSRDWRIGQYDIELFVADDGGSVETALREVARLVEKEQVHLLFGAHTTDVGYAIAEYAIVAGIPYIVPSVTADNLTQRRRHDLVIRTGWSASQGSHPLGQWAHQHLGARRVGTIAIDQVCAHESVAGFVRTFEAAGGQIVAQTWIPAETADYAPFLDQIPRNVDALFIQYSGTSAADVLTAIREMGWEVPIIAGTATADEHILSALDQETALNDPWGVYSVQHWTADDPHAQAFVDAFRDRAGRFPSSYAMESYAALQILEAAILEAGGFVDHFNAFLQAIRSLEFQTPKGIIHIDAWNNSVQDFHIRRIARGEDGELYHQLVYTFPMVSQFWTYDPEAFLALPAYSRAFDGTAQG